MSQAPKLIDPADLHAYADGQLAEDRRADVEGWLADNPDDDQRVAAWRIQNDAIRGLHRDLLDAAVPAHLRPGTIIARRRRGWLAAAAAAGWLMAGATAGWFAQDWYSAPRITATALAERALSAHRVYVVEVRHPVEVVAAEEKHLVRWLSKRLDHQLSVPDLSGAGFHLVGGRLLPAAGRPAAHFMFENAAGKRITLYAARNPDHRETAFRYQQEGRVGAFYWLDGPLGYAVIGEVDRTTLLGIARVVYDQFGR